MAVDYANSYYTSSYMLLGRNPELQRPQAGLASLARPAQPEWRALCRYGYARYDDKGLDAARSTPGEGRGAYVGGFLQLPLIAGRDIGWQPHLAPGATEHQSLD